MQGNRPLSTFVEEAKRIVSEAEKRGIILRVASACAIKIHTPEFDRLYTNRELSDIDLITYKKYKSDLRKFMISLGFTPNDKVIWMFGDKRHIYYDEVNKRQFDIFLDKLDFCHTVDLANRLELDNPTITITDIFLMKTQIVKLSLKDVVDLLVLFRGHGLDSESPKERFDVPYITGLLSNDWGHCYTVTQNLVKVKEHVNSFEWLSEEDRKDVNLKIDELLKRIGEAPKSNKWVSRAKIGTAKLWYNDTYQGY